MFSKWSVCGRIITSKICSSCLRYSVACCGHLVRAGRRVVTISFVSSSIIHRNMKLFQHLVRAGIRVVTISIVTSSIIHRNMKLFQRWIKWKGLICWFLHLFIDKEISRLLILSYFPWALRWNVKLIKNSFIIEIRVLCSIIED